MVGTNGLEPSTSRLSGVRSNHLSYAPGFVFQRYFQAPSKLNNTQSTLLTSYRDIAHVFLRKEVIQPHLPIRLPCYDLTLIINPTFDDVLLAVRLSASGVANSHGLTGGVYKARERIHRGMLIHDY